MLYDPNWTKPEIGSREHILLWLAGKPAHETFKYSDYDHCACAQYAAEHGLITSWWRWDHVPTLWDGDHFGNSLNAVAGDLAGKYGRQLVPFGALHEAAREAWGM